MLGCDPEVQCDMPKSADWRERFAGLMVRAALLVAGFGCSIDTRVPSPVEERGPAEVCSGEECLVAPLEPVGGSPDGEVGSPDGGVGTSSPGSRLEVTPGAVSFGSAVIGQSVPASVLVTNRSDDALSRVSARLAQEDGDFAHSSGNCVGVVPPGGACTLELSFTPSAEGERSERLIVSGEGRPPVTVELSGQGLLPGALTSSMSGFDFRVQEIGTASEPLLWDITNSGTLATGSLSVSSDNAAEFVHSGNCAAPLAPGQSCTMSVHFSPIEPSSRSATLRVSDGESSIQIGLYGSGHYRVNVTVVGGGTGTITASYPGLECTSGTCSALFPAAYVQLHAKPQNGADSYFAGWAPAGTIGGCSSLLRTCSLSLSGPATVGARFERTPNNFIFISSLLFPPDLGGVASYDAECNRVATEIGINDVAGRAYLAAMGDESASLSDRLPANARGWVRLDGLPFADTRSALFAPEGPIYYTVGLNDAGQGYNSPLAWSGAPGLSCSGWTSRARGTSGAQASAAAGPGWLEASSVSCQFENAPLICLGQGKSAPLAPLPAFEGKRLWVSNTTYAPGSTSPDEKCVTESPPGATRALALVARTDRPIAALIDAAATYVRPDGQLIGTGSLILAHFMSAGPWVTANGRMLGREPVWTGATTDLSAPGSLAATCSNWSDPGGTGTSGIVSSGNERAWIAESGQPCSSPKHLYCAEP